MTIIQNIKITLKLNNKEAIKNWVNGHNKHFIINLYKCQINLEKDTPYYLSSWKYKLK